jgi:hypothetical protein
MLRFQLHVLIFVLWLALLFNFERLDIAILDDIDIATPIYLASAVVGVIGLLFPWRRYRSAIVALTIGIVAFAVAKFIGDRPLWGGQYSLSTMFELGAVLITAVLATITGRQFNNFLDMIRALIGLDIGGPVYSPEEGEAIIKREMQYSRRANRPLSVLVVEASPTTVRQDLQAAAEELRQLFAERYGQVALTRVFARTLRQTDFMVDWADKGRLVIIAPDTRADQVRNLVRRLNDLSQKELGAPLRCGVASLDDHGYSFEELLSQAEQDLQLGRGVLREEIGLTSKRAIARDGT